MRIEFTEEWRLAMREKRNTKLGDSSHEKSVRLRQETKNKIDEMLANGTKITFKSVMEECGVSKGFVYDKDIRAYINEAQRMQKEEALNLPNQQQNLYWKLMASYIFQYSLMDEQEALLKDAIENLKARKEHRSQQADYSLKLLAHYLALETDSTRIKDELMAFIAVFAIDIPEWQEELITLIKKEVEDCPALEVLNLFEME